MFFFTDASRARPTIEMKFGIATEARIPMMTTTIISSTRVKPLRSVAFMAVSSGGRTGRRRLATPPPGRSGLLARRQDERQGSRLATALDRVGVPRAVRVRADARRRRHGGQRGGQVLDRGIAVVERVVEVRRHRQGRAVVGVDAVVLYGIVL